jgi:hypothetical protein
MHLLRSIANRLRDFAVRYCVLIALIPWFYLFCFYGQDLQEPRHPVLGAIWGFAWLLGPSFFALWIKNREAFAPCLLAAVGFFAPYIVGWGAWIAAQYISTNVFGRSFYLGRGIA